MPAYELGFDTENPHKKPGMMSSKHKKAETGDPSSPSTLTVNIKV